MQVTIIGKDQSALRFLWPMEKSILQYQYTRLIFGARCSRTIAIFVLNKTAQDFAPNQYIKDLVKRNFYMDNFLQSFETPGKTK